MLVAFEGIDGSGKSTALRSVARALRARGRRVVVTAEPTRTWVGRAVRLGIRSRLDPLALCALFLADRAAHVAALRPSLRGNAIVLTDRYADSTTAYQAAALKGRVRSPLERLRRVQAELFPRPDIVFLFDVDPAVSLRRIRGRRVREPFERIRFLRQVRKNYLRLAKAGKRRWRVLDARRPATELSAQIVRELSRRRVGG